MALAWSRGEPYTPARSGGGGMEDDEAMRSVTAEVYPSWQPDEIGLGRATLLSLLIVAAMVAAGTALMGAREPAIEPPPPMQVQIVQLPPEQLAQAPSQPVPPPPQPDVPPPPPPPVALAPPEVAPPSRIEIPRPPPPKPVAKPRPPKPVPPRPQPSVTSPRADAVPQSTATSAPPIASPPVSAPPADVASGIGPYRAGLHNLIQSHVEVGPQIAALGVSGTAIIEAVIGPDGHLISARVARSSGNGLIDKAALAAVQRGGFRPFGAHMPATPITISVPIEISPDAG